MNTHFLAKLGSFFRENKSVLAEMSEEDIQAAIKDARAHSGGKQKAENRMTMSEAFSHDGEWKLFMEQSFAEPPTTIQVLPKPGTYSHAKYGKFTMTPGSISAFVDNHNNHVYQEQVPIDAEHQSKLSGAIGYYGEMRLIDGGKGGAEADVNWTERGRQLIASDAFKYFSPEWFDEWQDPTGGKKIANVMVGGAITTRPYFKDKVMRPLVASEQDCQAGEWQVDSEGETPTRTLTMSAMQFSEKISGDLGSADLPDDDADTKVSADMTQKCPKCGKMSTASAKSCSGCGAAFPDPEDPGANANAKRANIDVGDVHVNKPQLYADEFTEFSPEQRKALAKSGDAMPDGSYPIRNKSDLSNAVQAYGRSPDESTKNHIKNRAAALGATSMLPDKWVGRKAAVEEIDEKTKEFVEGQTKQLTEKLETEQGLRKAAEDRLVKLETEAQTRRFTDIIMGRDGSGDGSPPFVGKHETHNKTLSLIAKEYGEDSDEFREYVSEARATSESMRKAGMFAEVGTGSAKSQVAGDGAERRFTEAADKWLETNPGKTKGDAVQAVAKSSPKLYAEYLREGDRKAKSAVTTYGFEEEGE